MKIKRFMLDLMLKLIYLLLPIFLVRKKIRRLRTNIRSSKGKNF